MSALELARLWSKRPDWLDDAACKGLTSLFFPERGDMRSVQQAREVCAGCPVQAQCTEAGMNERFGIWGGMGTVARSTLKRRREKAA